MANLIVTGFFYLESFMGNTNYWYAAYAATMLYYWRIEEDGWGAIYNEEDDVVGKITDFDTKMIQAYLNRNDQRLLEGNGFQIKVINEE
ncbi:MAG: hypothetical protein JXQ65_02415 [Candidatus Marinimicrobia bacterium]|nr:hypothetical protein [Candidatus Neomarinimicrobiota bacterium]